MNEFLAVVIIPISVCHFMEFMTFILSTVFIENKRKAL